ncbi:hypothetical protein CYMTET_8147 [Cymbomonas tetramitiformis]|uniref:Uncharacterized protein n=1 Tax=Cymbomonas tetramitiformis TaxID=36881 RepID=A0AAE0GU10_9CHLO|nr:hypothetical protein CYMTET_8147 [Cymbomonas tetramitiformis]
MKDEGEWSPREEGMNKSWTPGPEAEVQRRLDLGKAKARMQDVGAKVDIPSQEILEDNLGSMDGCVSEGPTFESGFETQNQNRR